MLFFCFDSRARSIAGKTSFARKAYTFSMDAHFSFLLVSFFCNVHLIIYNLNNKEMG